GEGVKHQVAGVAATADDGTKQSKRKLRRKLLDTLVACASQARNGRIDTPYVIPVLAIRAGAAVPVFGLAIAGTVDGGMVESESPGVLDAIEHWSAGAVELVLAVNPKCLIPDHDVAEGEASHLDGYL